MNQSKIQYGESVRKQIVDDSTTLTTHTRYRAGVPFASNRITKRDRIPTSRPSIEELEHYMRELFSDPAKINPSIGLDSTSNKEGTTYYIVTEYTLLEIQ